MRTFLALFSKEKNRRVLPNIYFLMNFETSIHCLAVDFLEVSAYVSLKVAIKFLLAVKKIRKKWHF